MRARVARALLRPAVVVLAFTLPKGYEMNKGDIDRAMDKAGRQVRATMAQATEFVNKNIIKPSKGPAPAPSKKTQ